MASLVQLVPLLCVCYIQKSLASSEKRILLSDPSFVQSTLRDMQVKIQDLTKRLAQQEAANTQQDIDQKTLTTRLETELLQQQAQLTQQDNIIKDILSKSENAGGGLFTRWGRSSCPGNTTELVYSGFAGGSWYGHNGAAADYVCLPQDPIYTSYFELRHEGRMFGAEYEGGSLDNQDVPCAVCRSTVYNTVMMIPARNECHNGWEVQYRGMLSSGSYLSHAASQYVCLDESIESVSHGVNNDDGKMFFLVIGLCGSLPCSPYKNNEALTCVVCAK